MRELVLRHSAGVLCVPEVSSAVGALTVAGSSGRLDDDRARVLAASGVTAASIRWFGGPGQSPGPYDVPLELFAEAVDVLRPEVDSVVLVGTSFGAEGVLAAASYATEVDAVVAFAPSSVVWAGIRPDGAVSSHWTLDGQPLPHVGFDQTWHPNTDPPAFVDLYRQSLTGATPEVLEAATIPVERIPLVLTVSGDDDRVWPASDFANRIVAHRAQFAMETTVITHPHAGHRAILPGEQVTSAGVAMQRGGSASADRELGAQAWSAMTRLFDELT